MTDETQIQDDRWEGARSEAAGSVIGAFTLVRLVGEGGFGDVWEAEQSEPVKRRVALKIVKLGMDTREVIARFAMERQTLAAMEHPHIAHVIDAGATATGRPYFAMEFVDGVPISDYCAAHKLPVDAILDLFMQVCAAVQHAHTKGVIHRDLKPSNVLVSEHDGRPFAKVIDFGIAKATGGEGRERTLATRVHQVVGTPLYMSPEQAIGSLDIDIRTDIYSLGVIVYELLTGTTPVEREKLASGSLAESQKLICETEPPRPSARVLSHATTLTGSTTFRVSDPRKLARTIRGDLDWIVMKALEKEPARRYQSVAEFADDLRRYLAGDAVAAVPPSLGYRSAKFVRRNKVMVVAGALVALSLLAGIAGFAWQARIAHAQTRFAQQQEQVAKARARDLQQVADFEANMLGSVDPASAGQRLADDLRAHYAAALSARKLPADAREHALAALDGILQDINSTDVAREMIDATLLKPAVAAIDRQFKGQPLVAAYLRQTLALRYTGMGLYAAAEPLQRDALDTRRRVLGADDPLTIASMLNLATLLDQKGRAAAGVPYAVEALQRARRTRGQDDPLTLQALSVTGSVYADDGRIDQAVAMFRQALATKRRVLGDDAPATLMQAHNLGLTLMYSHQLAEAEPLLREAAQGMQRALGADNEASLLMQCNYAYLLQRQGHLDQAQVLLRDAMARSRRALGADHPVTLVATLLTAMTIEKQARHAQAVALLLPIEFGVRRRFIDSRAFLRGTYLWQLGLARTGIGDYAAAEANLLEAHAIFLTTHNITHVDDLRGCTQALVALYTAWDKAEPGMGHAAKAQQWQARLHELGTAAQPAPAR